MNIILRTKDGHVAIMNLTDGSDKNDAIQKFQEQHPEFIEHFEVDAVKLPDRTYRDAWEFKRNKLTVNENKAKNILMERIREIRNQKLEELDKEQLKNLTDGGKVAEINQKKQLLRDAPTKITLDVSKSPIELLQDVLASTP